MLEHMGDREFILLVTLLAFAVRSWALGAKGLAYDEAATALMARATAPELIQFHWTASFEHPPFWQLLMHLWSQLAGQSEVALRFLPLLAGVVQTPLLWAFVRQGIGDRVDHNHNAIHRLNRQSLIANLQSLPALSCLLLACSPILVLYSQEARMYTVVVALALASLWVAQQLVETGNRRQLLLFVLLNWVMLGFHYYSVLLIGAELFYFVWSAVDRPTRWRRLASALALSLLPLLLWVCFSPGFRITATIVLQGVGGKQPGVLAFLDQLWRDLSFGAIRWQPSQALVGYGLLPLVLIGVVLLGQQQMWLTRSSQAKTWPALLVLLVLIFPLFFSTLFFRSLATRYILFVVPMLCWVIAAGIISMGRLHWSLGWIGLLLALGVNISGLIAYFGPYQKSDYKQMAGYLTQHLDPTDGVLLEAPRQHLLAKYYLPSTTTFYTAPFVVLPAYWPISAPPVVPEEMDGQLQKYLRQHPVLWLILTAEDEVDKGEFVSKYLTAVSFKQDCQTWLDVILCRFVSPHFTVPNLELPLDVTWHSELQLPKATLAVADPQSSLRALLVTLQWIALAKPTLDYRVTLRLVASNGQVVSQRDDFPIGNLLPPTTWQRGDEKPGYLALPVPTTLPVGNYQVQVGLYNPTSGAPLLPNGMITATTDGLITLAKVVLDKDLVLSSP